MPVNSLLTLALPKGRLLEHIHHWLSAAGFTIQFGNRQLIAQDSRNEIRVYLVKNADMPIYVHRGIAGLGVCGEDLLYEANLPLYKLIRLPFGSTRLCLAAPEGSDWSGFDAGFSRLRIASKFTRFTRDYFQQHNMPVEIIKLNGSVELAASLGLTSYIVDLVETGETLRANKLEILEVLKEIGLYIIANPAYYKYHYDLVRNFLKKIEG